MAFEYGIVHGRFQPFHNEHWHYTSTALARSERLIIGITNPDPGEVKREMANNHRHLPENNPYSFFQRLEMVMATLLDHGVDLSKIRVIPFHVSETEKWRYYLPPKDRVRHFLRIFSPWEQEKADRIRAEGYQVEVLDPGAEKGVEATEIRRRLLVGDGTWRELVPAAVARYLDDLHGRG